MNKKILISTTLAVIIVLAGFSSVGSAQTIKQDTLFQQIKDRIEKYTTVSTDSTLTIFIMLFYLMICFLRFFSSGYDFWSP